MANLMRREGREPSRSTTPEYRWDPFRVMDALFRFDPFRGEWGGLTQGAEFMPRFDVKETKDAYVIKADLPGVKEDDLNVSVNGSMLTISGKREEEHRDEGDRYYAIERGYGEFARSFTLPDGVDADNVSAELKNGELTLRLPKKPEAQPKKITIGKGGGEQKAKA
jgi:HSP20 family protein